MLKKTVTVLEKGHLCLDNNLMLDVSESYNESFILDLNVTSKKLEGKSDYINELFMFFFMKIKSHEKMFQLKQVTKLKVTNKAKLSWEVFSAAKNAHVSISKLEVLKHHVMNIFFTLISFILVLITSFVFPLLAFLKPTKKIKHSRPDFAIIRSPASLSKLKFLQDEDRATFYYDDLFKLKKSSNSFYSSLPMPRKVLSLFLIPIFSLIDFVKLTRDSMYLFGITELGFILFHYSLKIAHKCMYEYYLSYIMEYYKSNKRTYITAHKEDRFAVVDMKLSKKKQIKLICMPHGVEYSFYIPKGLPGDTFFCTTPKAAEHLNHLYGESKFTFDESIASKMFSLNALQKHTQKIVYFTEALGTDINIKIISALIELKIPFYVKLHPKDKNTNYAEYSHKFEYLDDFSGAISYNICLARKSTVLVEALYNNSIAIAVVIDPLDKAYVNCMIPSLLDDGIHQVNTMLELNSLLQSLRK
jgi:hypothetical protein